MSANAAIEARTQNSNDQRQQSTAAHRALSISEILFSILDYARDFDYPDEGSFPTADSRRTTYHAALVSRVFAEVAQDLLWEDIPSFRPLVRLLPLQLLGVRGFPLIPYVLTTDRLSPEDLTRFNAQARRVRYIQIEDSWPVDDSIYRALCAAYHERPLLPSLRGLQITGPPYRSPEHVLFLKSPIRYLTVMTPRRRETSESMMRTVLSNFALGRPGLETLYLVSNLPSATLCPLLSTFVLLRKIIIRNHRYPVDTPLLRHLLSLPQIEELTFVSEHHPQWILQALAANRGLGSLRHLQLTAPLNDLQPMLDMLPTRDVASICVQIDSDETGDAWLEPWMAFSNAAVARFGSSIRAVTLGKWEGWIEGDISAFRPWLGIRALHTLDLAERYDSSMLSASSDADMDELARALPCARSIKVRYAVGSSGSSGACTTLACLLSFALHCPLLEELEVQLVGREREEDKTSIPEALVLPQPHPLKTLEIHDLPSGSDVAIADFLFRLFPKAVVLGHFRETLNSELEALRGVGIAHDAEEAATVES